MIPIHGKPVSRDGTSTTSGQLISMFHQPHHKKCIFKNFSKATLFLSFKFFTSCPIATGPVKVFVPIILVSPF